MKIVLNSDIGSFHLSQEALLRYLRASSRAVPSDGSDKRSSLPPLAELRRDPLLVAIVEELGQRASGADSELTVATVPDDAKWSIVNVCGYEAVMTEAVRGKG